VRTSPVADLVRSPLPAARPGAARIGLLHGDLDASGGSYAPFTSREAQQAGLDAWLLGHIHKPSLPSGVVAPGAQPCGYLGSLVGLDPSEAGPHGPWLVHVSAAGQIALEQLVLAPLRWETVDARIGEDATPDDVGDRLLDVMEVEARRIADTGYPPAVLGLRVRLVGATRQHSALRRWIEAGSWSAARRTVGETFVFVDRVYDGLELAVDLAAIARGSDLPAMLARKLLALAQPGDERQTLLDAARERLCTVAQDQNWRPIEEIRDASDPLSDEALIATLLQSGRTALDELLSQTSSAVDAPPETAA
jgi:hypothetical protein